MTWKNLIEALGGEPVYLPSGGYYQTPIAVLTNGGVALAEPLYDRVVPILNGIGKAGILDMIGINDNSLLESLEGIVIGFRMIGIEITFQIFIIFLAIAAYVSNKLLKHKHIYVNKGSSPDTVIELLNQYFHSENTHC